MTQSHPISSWDNDILESRAVKIKPNENEHWYDDLYEDSLTTDAIDCIDLYGENKNPLVS